MNRQLLKALSEVRRLSFDLREEIYREQRVITHAALISYLRDIEESLALMETETKQGGNDETL